MVRAMCDSRSAPPGDNSSHGCYHPAVGYLRLRIRSVAVSRTVRRGDARQNCGCITAELELS